MSNAQRYIAPAFDPAKPDELKTALDRQGADLRDKLQNLQNVYAERFGVQAVVKSGAQAAAFGQMMRVQLESGGTMSVLLPRPDPKNGGRLIGVLRLATAGTVTLLAVGCNINGSTASVTLPAKVGLSIITFDGSNYFTSSLPDSSVATSTVITTTAPLKIDGGSSADLSANRTLAISLANSDRLLGRDTAGAGAVEELTVGGGVEFTGSGGIQTSALTGDVTKAAGGTATTIAADAVGNSKLRNSSARSVIGREFSSTGDPGDIIASSGSDAVLREWFGSIGWGTIATAGIANDAVTYAKIQNVSATDKLLGRSTAGSGDVEEIDCTAAGRALLDDANAAAQLVTLGAVAATRSISTTAPLTGGGDLSADRTLAISAASASAAGSMSAADFTKLATEVGRYYPQIRGNVNL